MHVDQSLVGRGFPPTMRFQVTMDALVEGVNDRDTVLRMVTCDRVYVLPGNKEALHG